MTMTTTIKLNDLAFYAYHGYYPTERKTGNKFVLNVALKTKEFDSISDDIGDTINYETVYNICDKHMNHPEKLLETLLFKIISDFRQSFPSMTSGTISIKKIQAQLGGKVGSSEIEMDF